MPAGSRKDFEDLFKIRVRTREYNIVAARFACRVVQQPALTRSRLNKQNVLIMQILKSSPQAARCDALSLPTPDDGTLHAVEHERNAWFTARCGADQNTTFGGIDVIMATVRIDA
jgi:hypothetical protein